MADFIKYPSIELNTHLKTLRGFCEYNPDVEIEGYQVKFTSKYIVKLLLSYI